MAEFVSVSSKRKRLTFGRARDLVELPDLVAVQRDSFRWFFQLDESGELKDAAERESVGIQELFDEIFPIESYDGSFALEFVDYTLEPSSITQEEARKRDMTWSRPVRATIRLVNRKTLEIKEEDVYLGDFPTMTERGTFIINGTERVVVNQLARSAGVYFSAEEGVPGQERYAAKVIPDRGAWLEFDLTPGEVISVNIDNKKKLPVTMLLKAFGVKGNDEILKLFNGVEEQVDLVEDEVRGHLIAENVSNESGQILIHRNKRITKEDLEILWNLGRTKVWVWKVNGAFAATLERDNTRTGDDAVLEIFRRLRPNEPARMENAKEYVYGLFFDSRRYNLGRVGRYKLNRRLGLDVPESTRLLTIEDIVSIVQELLNLRKGTGRVDDIDHLGNRRVRAVGELLQNQVRIGLLRMERIAKERMTTIPDLNEATARDLINVRPISASLREFFGSGQLSQFMDQTNPLAELTHRRRLSALGPGGLSRERAGFEARDVHYTHYGRVCPIETPEGPNIGLVTSLAVYSRINEYGFLQSPKRKVENGIVTNKVEYLSADEEDEFYVGRANTPLTPDGSIAEEEVHVRYRDDIVEVRPEEVQYLDVSPKQIVSASTALIPFLEHDDANRALMGSNMQRQAVPLIQPEAPRIGTGIEAKIAKDSGSCVTARRAGTITYVDSGKIIIQPADGGEPDEYHLVKFRRSNQGTVIHQKPIVKVGEIVAAGDILADGQSVESGELALGRNIRVAFVSWEGYNYEDAILVSERLVKDDMFTSIHIEEYETEARDTKLGPEEITRDIPNVGEDALKNLDETGVVRVGAEVTTGDILVGKVTPKGETDQTPEEKLLRAIFGEKAREVRDTSLRIPHGEGGKVVAVKRLSRLENGDELSPGVNEVIKVYVAQLRKITVGDKMAGRHGNKGVVSRILPEEDMPYMPDGTPVDVVLNPLGVPSRMNLGQVLETIMGFVAEKRGWYVSTPVFEGAKEGEIFELIEDLRKDGFPWLTEDGSMTLYDGRTGEPMEYPVTVGSMYMMKLIHLVDDKIHARSIGPYSLITQQPLGGKAQFGGQRFGEMEVWALEGYGAAHILQEMLTVKSDDIRGRLKTYERIVKGQNLSDPGVPESFRVLVKELQGLGLDVEISYDDGSRGELVYEEEEEYFPRSGRGKRERAEESPVRRMEDMFINTGENDAIEKDNEGESVFFEDVQDPKEGADE
ncbi:MAG: DNA-directed RNA polymerase subunit beta [Synergistales bacterium 53_16]|jgi:DNA-directed RNA polymerase subunit beta|nr:MAG: DNA-directed RNA polymerase subunit beta [Synergistales bacterium 53_16]MDK2846064.1 DNA-directed polymerase subunit beta [Synergistales bacterium]MDN5335944.1 DNA-directed polymerase subunit beta [Synergistales bacterium]HAG23197.1 DNA-directed RNA polymerase subunit beta [Synergistaceae bacterium]